MSDQVLVDRVRKLKTIIIFGGDLIAAEVPSKIPRPRTGLKVRSMDWVEGDIGGACPSYERALAAREAWKLNHELTIIASGGKSNVPGTNITATTAEVLRAELEALGVPSLNVLEEGESFTTLEQFANCAKLLGRNPSRFGFLSMGWHLNRIKMGLGAQNEVQILDGADYLSAERLLVNSDFGNGEAGGTWREYFEALDATPQMQARRLNESLGVEQLLTGYNSKYGQKAYRGFEDPLK